MTLLRPRVRSVTLLLLCTGALASCADPLSGPLSGVRGTKHVGSFDLTGGDGAAIQVGAGWSSLPSLPAPTSRLSAAASGSLVYVFGGANASNAPTRTTRAFNPTTGAWTTLAQMPAARADQDGAATVGNVVYVPGGRNAAGAWTRSLYAYNTTTNSWTTLAQIPTAGGCGGSVAIGNAIYVGHGCTGSGVPVADFYRYDIATNTWTALPQPNDFKKFASMFVLGGKIYWIGGSTNSGVESNAEVFDPATNAWSGRGFLPRAIEGFAAGVVRNVAVMTAGWNGSARYNETSYYDALVDTWRPTLPITTPRIFAASVALNDELFVIGGIDPTGATSIAVESYHLGDAWVTMAPMPTPRGYHAAANIGALTYAAGGRLAGANFSYTVNEVYDAATNSWTTRAPLPAGRWAAAGAAVNGRFYVIGGFTGGTIASPQATVFEYNPATNTWRTRAPLPVAIGFPTATAVGGRIYVNDGGDGVNMFGKNWYAYTPGTNSWTAINQSPDGFGEGAAARVGNLMAAVGGYGPGFSLQNNFETYDPSTNNWSFGPQLPLGIFGHVARALGSHLYVAGGSDAGGNKVAALQHYDYLNPAPWDFLTPMPTARSHAIVTSFAGMMMVVGGWDDTSSGTGVSELYLP